MTTELDRLVSAVALFLYGGSDPHRRARVLLDAKPIASSDLPTLLFEGAGGVDLTFRISNGTVFAVSSCGGLVVDAEVHGQELRNPLLMVNEYPCPN